ncbi:MAG: hypothetical protein AB7N76_35785 [Planctomycetota bacterium]
MPRLVLPLLLLFPLLTGCGDPRDDGPPTEVIAGDLPLVVDGRDVPIGVSAVVRLTPDWVVVMGVIPAGQQAGCFLRAGNERLPLRVEHCDEVAVLTARRGGRPFRPVAIAPSPEAGQEVLVQPPRRPGERARVAALHEGFLTLEEVNLPDTWVGGVLTRFDGALIGFVTGVVDRRDDGRLGRPRAILVPAAMTHCLRAVCAAPGADALVPDEGFAALELRVQGRPEPAALPQLPDDWGGADIYLGLDRGPAPLARFRLDRDEPPALVAVPSVGALRARLVERDVTLSAGVVEEDLAPALAVDPTRGPERLAFRLDPGGTLAVGLGARVLDPDERSGPDRTPLGARPLRLRRVAAGDVDLRAGDATDFWRLEESAPGEHLLFLYVRDPHATLEVEGWVPGEPRPRFRLVPGERRIVAQRRTLPGGPFLVRVRQTGGEAAAAYGLLLGPRDEDPSDLVRTLFRLVGAEATRQRSAFLASQAFALQMFQAIQEHGALAPGALARAILAQLGHRIAEARLLALNLLEVYAPPSPEELELARREGGRRGVDAGLLLALRCPTVRAYVPVWRAGEPQPPRAEGQPEAPWPLPWQRLRPSEREEATWAAEDALREAIVGAAGDPDPRIRERAVATLARLREEDLRRVLRERLEGRLGRDPSASVRRALLTAFPPALR